jgi:tRNA(Arg) A34 adenosine deaminase TadA
MPNTGAFESSYGIHWRQELNHRFHVFGGWLQEQAHYVDPDAYV